MFLVNKSCYGVGYKPPRRRTLGELLDKQPAAYWQKEQTRVALNNNVTSIILDVDFISLGL